MFIKTLKYIRTKLIKEEADEVEKILNYIENDIKTFIENKLSSKEKDNE